MSKPLFTSPNRAAKQRPVLYRWCSTLSGRCSLAPASLVSVVRCLERPMALNSPRQNMGRTRRCFIIMLLHPQGFPAVWPIPSFRRDAIAAHFLRLVLRERNHEAGISGARTPTTAYVIRVSAFAYSYVTTVGDRYWMQSKVPRKKGAAAERRRIAYSYMCI